MVVTAILISAAVWPRSAAAQLRLVTDRRQGITTPDWIKELARRSPGPPDGIVGRSAGARFLRVFDRPYNRHLDLPRVSEWERWRGAIYPMLEASLAHN